MLQACGRCEEMHGQDPACQHGADKSADTPQNKSDKTLAGAANFFVSFAVHVKLSRDKKEVVTDAMQENGQKDHWHTQTRRAHASRQKKIARGPRQDAEK